VGYLFTSESRGRGYFKLNSKILENEEYKEIIKQLISKYQKQLVIQKTDPRTLWDVFKAEVRDVTVKICKQISHEKNYELYNLEKNSSIFTIKEIVAGLISSLTILGLISVLIKK
jgi:DNA polymerase III gamma/tau subunit